MSRLLFWSFESTGGVPATPLPSKLREIRDEVYAVFDEDDGATDWRSHMITRRQGDQLPAIRAVAYSETGLIDFTQFTSIAFRMVSGGTVVTGQALGDQNGNLTYTPASSDFSVPGTYSAVFIATDPTGKKETFPMGSNLTVMVVPSI